MLTEDPKERITLNDIRCHPWLNPIGFASSVKTTTTTATRHRIYTLSSMALPPMIHQNNNITTANKENSKSTNISGGNKENNKENANSNIIRNEEGYSKATRTADRKKRGSLLAQLKHLILK